MLRDTMIERAQNPGVGRVPELVKGLSEADQDGPVLPRGEIRDILEQDSARPQRPYDPMKLSQRCARGSSADLAPPATRPRILDRPARENGWQGTPPATRSTLSIPQAPRCSRRSPGSVRSPRYPSPLRFAT